MSFFENTRKPQGFGGKLMTKMMNSGHSRLSQWGFSNISVNPDAEVLDVGCGGGANIAVWLNKCRKGHVTGLDYSEVSVAESQKLNAAAIQQGKCKVVQGDVSAIPFPDANFDHVSAFETVYFWPELKKCFSEVNRVLKDGGTFLICNESDGMNASDDKWTKIIDGMKIYNCDQLITALKEAGFMEILKIAMLLDKHDTIGIDCVAMCVNDVICCGAKPLFFLDYIACGKNYPEKIASIVSGVAEGCVRAGCALIGGETAEHPGMMPEDDYDLAGFTVGIVNKPDVFDNKSVKAGDVIIALPSSGVHSNGFSLVRKVFDFDKGGIDKTYDELGSTIGEALLTPTEIYVKPVLALAKEVKIKAVSHITGGGFYENIPRSLPEGITAVIEKKALKILPVFDIIEKTGNIPERDMFNTFNMGVGMSITVAPEDADRAVRILRESGTDAYIIGETASGEDGVKIC